MYVSKDKRRAVVFAFDIYPRYNEKMFHVIMEGLDPAATYNLREINRADGSQGDTMGYSGNYLMTVGVPLFTDKKFSSRVYELTAK